MTDADKEPTMPKFKTPTIRGKRTYLALAGALVTAAARPFVLRYLPPDVAEPVLSLLTEEVAAAIVTAQLGLAAVFRAKAAPITVTDTQARPSAGPTF